MDRLSSLLLGSICNLLVFLLQVTSVYAQDKYIIHHYTNENGLPSHGIKGLALDKETGFLWVGTQSGLVRFDGIHFEQFGESSDRDPTSRITFIAKNPKGTIFCEDENLSVYRIEKNIPIYVGTDTLLSSNPFTNKDRRTWLAPEQVAEKLQSYPRSLFLPGNILFHDQLIDSNSFALLHFNRLYYYDAIKDTLLHFYQSFPQIFKAAGNIYFIDENNSIWTYNQGLKQVPVKGMPYRDNKSNDQSRFVWTPGMKGPLLIYKQDIWQLQVEGDSLSLYPFCRGCCPKDAYINSAQVFDERGIIFLGSEKNGLYVIQRSFIHTIRTDTLVDGGGVEYAQAEINPGIITTGRGLSFSTQGKLFFRKEGIQFHPLTLYQDKSGDYWFRSDNTIFHYHKNGRYTKMTIEGGKVLKMVFGETQGQLYVFTDMAISEIVNDSIKTLYKLPHLAKTIVNTLEPDAVIEWKPGVFAIAADKPILFNVRNGKTYTTIPIPGLTTKVRSLLKYHDYMLIGTYGQGFYMYKNGVVKKIPLDKYKYLSHVHCFILDDKGFCWISTNRGLFKVSMKALVDAYERNLPEIYYHHLGKKDGIYNTEFNGGCQPCALKLRDGRISFPSINGVAIISPLEHSPPPAGEIFIDELRADSASYKWKADTLLAFPYNTKSLHFKLALSRFANAENIYFSYKLEPYNESWEVQDITQNNVLQFGGLKPGKYKLHLRVRNGFETDQFKITTISFRVLSPWYQTWWFYTLCFIVFVVFVWGVVKWRTARIEKKRKELQQLVTKQTESLTIQSMQLEHQLIQLTSQQAKLEQDNRIKSRLLSVISHDMLSPIKFISYLSKKMSDTIPESDENHRVARSMASVTHDMESLTVNLLNWIRFHYNSLEMSPERFNLYQLIKETTDIPSGMAREKGVTFVIEVQEKLEILQYKQALGIVIYNLATNAVKYTSNGEVRITGSNLDNAFFITITDTGKGMPNEMVERLNDAESFDFNYLTKENKRYQFGYVIIKDLVCMLNATMKVESILNKGTSVTIRLSNL